jgi:3-dehydroquinate dehydratase type I
MGFLRESIAERTPLIVGSIGDQSGLRADPGASGCDLVELRLDLLGTGVAVADYRREHGAGMPLLFTARRPDEGGHGGLDDAARSAALEQMLDGAAAIDVEMRSLDAMRGIWSEAGARKLVRVASYHDFENTPCLEELTPMLETAAGSGADVAKFAFRLGGPEDLGVLAALLGHDSPVPVAAMGMGPLAPASRLLAMQLGSVLSYGYLGEAPTAPGQWPAQLLRAVRDASPAA